MLPAATTYRYTPQIRFMSALLSFFKGASQAEDAGFDPRRAMTNL